MLSRVRIKVGLDEYSFELRSHAHRAERRGRPLRPRAAARVVRRLRARELRRLEGLIRATGRAPQRRDPGGPGLEAILADLVVAGRITVSEIEPKRHRPKGKIPEAYAYEPPETEPVENEIVETHSVMITLKDTDGNPIPGEPFRIELPDGTVETATLDEQGEAYITGITRAGECKVCFYERDAAVWSRVQ